MKIVVLKFGGTSVGSISRIKKVAKIISRYVKSKKKVIVVSSAMSGVTNDLISKTKKISNNFSPAEYDTIVSSGEQISCALISVTSSNLSQMAIVKWITAYFFYQQHFSQPFHL